MKKARVTVLQPAVRTFFNDL